MKNKYNYYVNINNNEGIKSNKDSNTTLDYNSISD